LELRIGAKKTNERKEKRDVGEDGREEVREEKK